jgi:hypothetical protein
MKARGISLVLFAGVCWAGPLPSGAGEKKAPNFYPLQVGNTWHFRAEVGGKTASSVYKVARLEKDGDKEFAILEVSSGGRVVATEHLQQTDKGVFRHKFNGAAIEPPFRLLPFPILEKWDGDVSSGGTKGNFTARSKQEEVEVPAGKFKATRVDFDLVEKGNKVSTSYWFVENMGFVKQTVEAGPVNVVLVLEKFEKAGKK